MTKLVGIKTNGKTSDLSQRFNFPSEAPIADSIAKSMYGDQSKNLERNEIGQAVDFICKDSSVLTSKSDLKQAERGLAYLVPHISKNSLKRQAAIRPRNKDLNLSIVSTTQIYEDSADSASYYLPSDEMDAIFQPLDDSARFDEYIDSMLYAQQDVAEMVHPVHQKPTETKDSIEFKQFLAYLEKRIQNKRTLKAILTRIAAVENPLSGQKTSEDVKKLLSKSSRKKGLITADDDKAFRAMALIVKKGPSNDFNMEV